MENKIIYRPLTKAKNYRATLGPPGGYYYIKSETKKRILLLSLLSLIVFYLNLTHLKKMVKLKGIAS